MRRAVERYLGQPEGSSSKPETVAAHRTLNLPLSRSGSRMSLHEEHHNHQQHAHHHNSDPHPPSSSALIPIIKEPSSSAFSRHHHTHSAASFFNGEAAEQRSLRQVEAEEPKGQRQQLVKRATEENQISSQWDTLYSQPELNWKDSSIWNNNTAGLGSPGYYRRDEALTKSSGTLPGDPNSQFESTFKKEICESITRY